MATDVQARDTGNSAMAIALVALVLLVIGAFAYFGFGNRVVETPGPSSTTVITQPQAPDVHVDAPPVIVNGGSSGGSTGSAPSGTSSSSTTSSTTTTTNGGSSAP